MGRHVFNLARLRSMRGGGRFLHVLGILASLACAGRAAASEPSKKAAKAHYKKGASEYTLGHFAASIVEFEQAYQQDPVPILLFNIAQAHWQNGNHERAAFFYRRYLEQEPDAPNRAVVEKRIRGLAAPDQSSSEREQKASGESSAQDHREPTTSPGMSATATATPLPIATPAPANTPTDTTSLESDRVARTADSPVLEPAGRFRLWASAGPSFPDVSGLNLDRPTLLSLRAGFGYSIRLGDRAFLEVDLSGGYAPFHYLSIDHASHGSGAFTSALATGLYRYRVGAHADVSAEAGAGAVFWSGLDKQNPFTVGGAGVSGAALMPSLLLGVAATFRLPSHFAVFVEPTFLLSAASSVGLRASKGFLSRLDLAFGAGYWL